MEIRIQILIIQTDFAENLSFKVTLRAVNCTLVCSKWGIERLEKECGPVAKVKQERPLHVQKTSTGLQSGLMKKLRSITMIDHWNTPVIQKQWQERETLSYLEDSLDSSEIQLLFHIRLKILAAHLLYLLTRRKKSITRIDTASIGRVERFSNKLTTTRRLVFAIQADGTLVTLDRQYLLQSEA